MDIYRYELKDREIRLIVLKEGGEFDRIHCEVKVVSLDSADSDYEAVSYYSDDHNSPRSW